MFAISLSNLLLGHPSGNASVIFQPTNAFSLCRLKEVRMMGRRIGKEAGVEVRRMRRKDPDRESVNEAETAEAGDRAAEKRGGGGGVGVAKGEDGVGAVTGGEVGAARIVEAVAEAGAEIEETGVETEGWRQDWAAQLAGVAETGRRVDPPKVLPVAWEMFTANFTSETFDLQALNSLSLLRRGTAEPSSACNSVRG